MSGNTAEQLEMGNRRSRSPAHQLATQAVAPTPAVAVVTNDANSSSGSNSGRSNEPFLADRLNLERRVVLQLREGCGLEDAKNNKMHAAFEIFNVAANVASFTPLPRFELQDELLEAFQDYVLKGKQLATADRYALSRVTYVNGNNFLYSRGLETIDLSPLSNVRTIGDNFLSKCSGLKTIDLSSLSNVTTVGDDFLYCCSGLETIDLSALSNVTTVGGFFLFGCSDTVRAQGKEFLKKA